MQPTKKDSVRIFVLHTNGHVVYDIVLQIAHTMPLQDLVSFAIHRLEDETGQSLGEHPVVLAKHEREMKTFGRTTLYPEDFLDKSFPYRALVIEEIPPEGKPRRSSDDWRKFI